MHRQKTVLLAAASLVLGLVCLPVSFARASTFSAVEPVTIKAGTFYRGATLHIQGDIGEGSQVAIRIKGASEHHVFNRRGKIGGFGWGGIGHVTFHHAPSFYAVYSSWPSRRWRRPACETGSSSATSRSRSKWVSREPRPTSTL